MGIEMGNGGPVDAAAAALTRRDCYWLCVVADCDTTPKLQEPIEDPARLDWHEVVKVQHYWLEVNAPAEPMRVERDRAPYRRDD